MNDTWHRPHADYTDQEPHTVCTVGPTGLDVRLDAWGPHDILPVLGATLQANWGDRPMTPREALTEFMNGTGPLVPAFQGQTLAAMLEGITFWFTIDGVSRACTHQLVRTRFAAFSQHGGRDNDWRMRTWTVPETIWRASKQESDSLPPNEVGCADMSKIHRRDTPHRQRTLWQRLTAVLEDSKNLYADLVDAGIPWQDARRVLPMGLQTYLHATYNYTSLAGFLANRPEHIMDWEINCVAQLMVREVKRACPPILADALKSHSDRAGRAAFAGLTSWPPDGKFPVPPDAQGLKRRHRPEQNPFWVLHPESMAGGPIQWIKTNGSYDDVRAFLTQEGGK